MTNALKPAAVACRDGTRFAVESVGGGLIVTTPAADPAREQAGLAVYEAAVQVRAGVLRHDGVPIDVVRCFIRAHGGFEAAGAEALETFRAAGQGGGEAARERPFPESRPGSRLLPAPRIPPGSLPGITTYKLPGA
ncbi:hypothetical protein [Methylobacterium sp. AMS5]|uniref:hypothetical protein n=1 Tax=Methylobacterium sp. AMS5 TaxID=925818 RepID=UPI00074FA329|nr:hypothetical protein [Methylobacterium sp. AMS5]AMB45080.1 hypothetical protein Y590_09230 [Methylobacterium sp. AMS5]